MPAVVPRARRIAPAIMVVGVAVGVAILLAALGLWFHYGTAVFFEMIASGIAACFSSRERELNDGSDRPPAGHRRSIRRQPRGGTGVDPVGSGGPARCGSSRGDRRAVSTVRS